jgi:hypothetical protein
VAETANMCSKRAVPTFALVFLFKSNAGAKAEALEHLHLKRESNSFILE